MVDIMLDGSVQHQVEGATHADGPLIEDIIIQTLYHTDQCSVSLFQIVDGVVPGDIRGISDRRPSGLAFNPSCRTSINDGTRVVEFCGEMGHEIPNTVRTPVRFAGSHLGRNADQYVENGRTIIRLAFKGLLEQAGDARNLAHRI